MGPKIILIDPNEEWRDRIIVYLRDNGYECTASTDLEVAEQVQSGTSELTLIFVDQSVAEKGIVQIRSFADNEVYPGHYVIVLFSAQLTISQMAKYFRMGSYDSVDKPYAPSSFLRMVEHFRRELNEEDMQSQETIPSFLNINSGFIF